MGRIGEDVPDLVQPRPALEAGFVAHVPLDCWGPGSVLGWLLECK